MSSAMAIEYRVTWSEDGSAWFLSRVKPTTDFTVALLAKKDLEERNKGRDIKFRIECRMVSDWCECKDEGYGKKG